MTVERFKIEGFKIHFVAKDARRHLSLARIASLFNASIQIHPDLQSLGEALKLSSHPRQIIVYEREEKVSDMMLLSFARMWPTIIIDAVAERGPGTEKKHCYWKLNAFSVGAKLSDLPMQMLQFAFEGLRPGARSALEFIPWYAAKSVWKLEAEGTKKLSSVFEDFFSKFNIPTETLTDAVEFAKFSQNRAKGRGTFKTKSIVAANDGRQLFIMADLYWFNKSDSSLRTVFNSIKGMEFDFAVILSPDQHTLQIIARFDLEGHMKRKLLMVAGMSGVKISRMSSQGPIKAGAKNNGT